MSEIKVEPEYVLSEVNSCFTECGRFTDEVKLEFDDGKTLYVASSFLSMASPVFEAMLTGDFKEKTTGVVKMTGKSCEDMTTLLQCIHPAVLMPIDTSNVLKIVPIADEYQMNVIIRRCKQVMDEWMSKLHADSANLYIKHKASNPVSFFVATTTAFNASGPVSIPLNHEDKNKPVIKNLLNILCMACQLNYDDLLQKCIRFLGLFWHAYLCGNKITKTSQTPHGALHVENLKQFSALPKSLQIQILIARLENIGTNKETLDILRLNQTPLF